MGPRNDTRSRSVTTAGPSSRLLLYTAIGAGAGVLAMTAVQAATRATDSSADTFSDPVKRRLTGTYGYLAGSLATTAAAAGFLFRSGVATRMMGMNPIVIGIGSMVGMIGTMMWTRSVNYYESPMLKHIAFGSFVGFQVSSLPL